MDLAAQPHVLHTFSENRLMLAFSIQQSKQGEKAPNLASYHRP